jgi:phosphohistidine phosphatase SixA
MQPLEPCPFCNKQPSVTRVQSGAEIAIWLICEDFYENHHTLTTRHFRYSDKLADLEDKTEYDAEPNEAWNTMIRNLYKNVAHKLIDDLQSLHNNSELIQLISHQPITPPQRPYEEVSF